MFDPHRPTPVWRRCCGCNSKVDTPIRIWSHFTSFYGRSAVWIDWVEQELCWGHVALHFDGPADAVVIWNRVDLLSWSLFVFVLFDCFEGKIPPAWFFSLSSLPVSEEELDILAAMNSLNGVGSSGNPALLIAIENRLISQLNSIRANWLMNQLEPTWICISVSILVQVMWFGID